MKTGSSCTGNRFPQASLGRTAGPGSEQVIFENFCSQNFKRPSPAVDSATARCCCLCP
ncbi:hypothetical protein DWUX_344 [Desulfovibrio diazotrophicus]|nr:hypothetical protein DWUX_344 [Desulfovibrio diazotrophicus]